MGGSDYGIYVYVWTWVLLLGSMMDFGISSSAQKIIPEYRTSGEHALLRGFLSGSRWMTLIVSSIISALLAGLVTALSPWIGAGEIVPLYIGCLTLPAFVVANTQDGIARSHDWMRLGLMPQFIIRQALIIGFTAGAFALGFRLGATTAMLASAAAVWIAMIGQMIVLNRRLGGYVEAGPSAYDFRGWLAISLPILLVESFYLLLSYTDVLVLQQFRPPEEVGVYFAVVKTLAWSPLFTTRCQRPRHIVSPNTMRSATRNGCPPMSRMRSNGRSGRRYWRRRCCSHWASRYCGCSDRNSSAATTSCLSPRSVWWCARRSARSSGCSTCSATSISAHWPMRWRS